MAKLTDPCVVYWKHTPEMTSWDQGYIGISGSFEHRMKQHDRDAYLMNSPLEVHHQMRLNKGNVITDIIFEGNRQQCLDMEFKLRPRWNMAWNMAAGGMFSNEWKTGGDWLSNKLWHPEYGEYRLTANFNAKDLCRKYGYNTNSGSNICAVLRGNLIRFKGWELQDKQLSQRVEDRYRRPLEEIGCVYLKGNELLKVNPNGLSALRQWLINSQAGSQIYQLVRGLRPSIKGYSLCTEEEYLANPGPVFGTEE